VNYLAHFHLAAGDDELIQGALLGDFVKGHLRGEYPPGIERGIALHRSIDALSNADGELAVLRTELPDHLRRYSGIITDVAFDFYLSRHWLDFHSDSLEHFAQTVYAVLARNQHAYPANARAFCQRLIDHDLLTQYGQWEAVDRVLTSIGWRLARDNPLRAGAEPIEHRRAQLREAFLSFYPRAQRHVDAFLAANPA